MGKDLLRINVKHIEPFGEHFRAVGMAGSLTTSYLIGMATMFLIAYTVINKGRTVRDLALMVFQVLCAVMIMFTCLSRGPFFMIFFALLFSIGVFRLRKAIYVFLGLVTASVIAIFSIKPIYERFSDLTNMKSVSITERLKIWQVNMDCFFSHPFFGVGFGNPQFYLKEGFEKHGWFNIFVYASRGSNYTEFLAGTGIFGFMGFYIVCFLLLKYAYECFQNFTNPTLKSFALGLFAAQIYFHLSGFIEGVFFSVQPRHMILFIWSMTVAFKIYAQKLENGKSHAIQ
jgi:hypothetical protein